VTAQLDARATAANHPPVHHALQILLVFLVAFLIVVAGWRLVGADPFARQAVVWVANVGMLVTIWIGLRVRGQTWEHLVQMYIGPLCHGH
jgi:membrane protein YdbS with pleckstrin-like domain